MTKYIFNLYGRSVTSFKSVGHEIAKVIKVMKPYTKKFVETNSRKYPFKPSLHIDFDPMDKEFYIGTGAWTVILSTDTKQDAHMQLTTPEYLCVSCDDELDLICAIRDHRRDFVNKINETLNK